MNDGGIKICMNCEHFRDNKCLNKQHNYGAFRQTYWSCENWEPCKRIRDYEVKRQKVQEMVDLWIKDDAPDFVKKAAFDELMRQPINDVPFNPRLICRQDVCDYL